MLFTLHMSTIERVNGGLFGNEASKLFRILIQKYMTDQLMLVYKSAVETGSSGGRHRIAECFRLGCQSVSVHSSEDKARDANVIVAMYPDLPSLYETTFLAYVSERYAKHSNLDVTVASFRRALYAITREVFLHDDVQSGEYLQRMPHADKCFFMENAIRAALHAVIVQGNLVRTHNVMPRPPSSSSARQPPPPPMPQRPPSASSIASNNPRQYTSSVASGWGSDVIAATKSTTAVSSHAPPPPSTVVAPPSKTQMESAAHIDTSTVNLLQQKQQQQQQQQQLQQQSASRHNSTTFDVMAPPSVPLSTTQSSTATAAKTADDDDPSTTTKQLLDLPPSLTDYGDEVRSILTNKSGVTVQPEDSASNMVMQKQRV